jgi:carboxyl-terminal processing protease
MRKASGILILIFVCHSLYSQMSFDQQQAITLKRMIERKHYNPRVLNDSFSSELFDKIITGLDNYNPLFTADEYKTLNAFRYKLDDELTGGSWQFLNTIGPVYLHALKRADSLVNVILQKPLDLTIDEKTSLSRKPTSKFPDSIAEMKKKWNSKLKWQMLNSLYDLSVSQSKKAPLKELITKNEEALRNKIKRSVLADFQLHAKPKEVTEHVKEIYLVALSTSFDPHTLYFSAGQKEDFQEALSSQTKSFGFIIDEAEGKVVIKHLIPGGPAWKSGEIHRNDQVLQLQFDAKDIIDVSLFSANEIEELLYSTEAEILKIKIKKSSGTVKEVDLLKEKIDVEENIVKGYLLKGNKKIGYISLPDFYTSWNTEGGSSCADDVAKEILKLKKENIEGLILDVRYNGGGSLDEALQLIGIFINEGPLVGIKGRDGKTSYLKDPHRGTIYDGPMVVLINGQSASASEALAACLQDYNRALVAGSTSYGKGSMQEIFPVDTTAGNRMVNSPFGFVKITTGKFYRLNGTTAQLKGVIPDVYLPDAFDALDYKEKFVPNALPDDTIKENIYYKPLQPIQSKEVVEKSFQRNNEDPNFISLKKSLKQFAVLLEKEEIVVPLQYAAFEKWREEHEKMAVGIDKNIIASHNNFNVHNHGYDQQQLLKNAYAVEINSIILKNLQQDIYLKEAFFIINDLIQSSEKK